MIAGAGRIWALWLRYALLHRRSLVRMFDIVFWPVLDLLVWGFVTRFIQQEANGPIAHFIIFLIGALIGWDIHYRGQQAVTISLMEEIWTRNLVNLLIAPVRLLDWVAATFFYGAAKVAIIAALLSAIAQWLYAFHIAQVGWAFVPLAANLLIFGWTVGLITSGILLRFGYAAEALIWGIPFLLQPFSCVFYPLRSLPEWAQPIALALPTTHIFEALRGVLIGQPPGWPVWSVIGGLNLVYFAAAIFFFTRMFSLARTGGYLGRLGQD